jgi:hypothetical protein
MKRELTVTCPGCHTILVIDRNNGAVLETRKKLVEESSGDRFADAFKKVDEDKKKRDDLFDTLGQTLAKRKKAAEELFNASLEEAINDDTPPENIFDRA